MGGHDWVGIKLTWINIPWWLSFISAFGLSRISQSNRVIYHQSRFDIQDVRQLIVEKVIEFQSVQNYSLDIPLKHAQLISWEPLLTWIKFNANDCTIGNVGILVGVDFFDSQGHWIIGYAHKIGITNCNSCRTMGYSRRSPSDYQFTL